MKKIRKNVFETNSSSMHSLVISEGFTSGRNNSFDFDFLTFGEFGWGYEELSLPVDKASYVLTYIQYTMGKGEGTYDREFPSYSGFLNREDYQEAVTEYYKKLFDAVVNSDHCVWLLEMIKKETGKKAEILPCDDYYPLGYIDHQSLYPSIFAENGYWSEDKETFKENMKNIIFDNKFKIVIDNDNH
jgi:hypothetical protein